MRWRSSSRRAFGDRASLEPIEEAAGVRVGTLTLAPRGTVPGSPLTTIVVIQRQLGVDVLVGHRGAGDPVDHDAVAERPVEVHVPRALVRVAGRAGDRRAHDP